MPKKSKSKALCQKKRKGRKATNETKQHAANMISHPLTDLMIDISPQNKSVSELTSSVNSNNYNGTKYATSAAMVEALEMLKLSKVQKNAFAEAMNNSLFRSLVENYNNVMPETTLAASHKRMSRKKQSAVDTITSSISSLSTRKEKMQ